jgi:hypothetical protein
MINPFHASPIGEGFYDNWKKVTESDDWLELLVNNKPTSNISDSSDSDDESVKDEVQAVANKETNFYAKHALDIILLGNKRLPSIGFQFFSRLDTGQLS